MLSHVILGIRDVERADGHHALMTCGNQERSDSTARVVSRQGFTRFAAARGDR